MESLKSIFRLIRIKDYDLIESGGRFSTYSHQQGLQKISALHLEQSEVPIQGTSIRTFAKFVHLHKDFTTSYNVGTVSRNPHSGIFGRSPDLAKFQRDMSEEHGYNGIQADRAWIQDKILKIIPHTITVYSAFRDGNKSNRNVSESFFNKNQGPQVRSRQAYQNQKGNAERICKLYREIPGNFCCIPLCAAIFDTLTRTENSIDFKYEGMNSNSDIDCCSNREFNLLQGEASEI
ncbi:hypothetical protein AYI70_g3727 [Smittium culicis]|uniref:Uncharacterized protein n=1 Tax=Smittium culicis TaxID=133412 RepID=A0A1R1Y243_9FUNG|nr:hypothetical protein AYI70_g9006 [Smittium culicis]OMJ18239.1 hypothetical protein AYI70_g5473 [Smittium culicis]OMJ21021.1 hypothetical protein AYI70_g3727 [Smittium culicis]